MTDHKPTGAFLSLQNFAVKSAWIRGTAVTTGGILLFCCCMIILTVSSCTLGN
jgi:hypothetical protein